MKPRSKNDPPREFGTPPDRPVPWRVLWIRTSVGGYAAPREPASVMARTWFDARRLARQLMSQLEPGTVEVEVAL